MNLGYYLHARWQASPSLNGLLPVDKVMTGLYFTVDPGPSYATITLPGGTAEGYANDGSSVDNVAVRVQVHDSDYDRGGTIVAAILATFDRADFPLSGNDRLLSMQKAGMPRETQDPHTGQWEWTLDFQCRVYLAPETTEPNARSDVTPFTP
jgi:hypothetical protein